MKSSFALDRTRPAISSSIIRMREQDRLRQQQKNPGPTGVNELQTRQIFNHRYEIINTLNETGGMSKMFLAYDPVLEREVVLKTTDITALDRYFRAESQVLQQDLHPMFPAFIESGRTGNISFIAMEKIEGRTLKALIQRGEPIPLHQAIDITMSVLYGLKNLHQDGEGVHRDIKPDNIMIEENGRTRLVDFGLVSAEGYTNERGMVEGTPTYLSPEQALNTPLRNNSDIYSLGLILYEMMAGYNPAGSYSPLESIQFHMDKRRPVPQLSEGAIEGRLAPEHRESLGRQVEQATELLNNIVQLMTAKDPDVRYQEVTEATRALEVLREIAEELRPFESTNT